MNKSVANTGTFISRIEKNVELGWEYPNNVIVKQTTGVGGNSGNITTYHFFDGEKFTESVTIPDWAGRGSRTMVETINNSRKYKSEFIQLSQMKNAANGEYGLQEFITMRK